MGRAFGFDFGNVRIYSDGEADQEATALGARAYTVGHRIGFAASAYQPGTVAGQRLIAHELAHVVQQAQGAPAQVQRDIDKRAPKDPLAEQLTELDGTWKRLRATAKGSALAADWLVAGDAVLALIHDHVAGARAAAANADAALVQQYVAVLTTDRVAYDYIVWHAFLYQNLDRIDGRMKGLAEAFRNDDRAFTGRKQALAHVTLLNRLVAKAKQESPTLLKGVRANVSHSLTGGSGAVPVTLTTAADASVRAAMTAEIDAVKRLETSVELVVNEVNQFVNTAFSEGLAQAGDAVLEFYKVKKAVDVLGGGKDPKPTEEKKPETKPDLQPMPVPPVVTQPDDDKTKKTCASEYPTQRVCTSLPAEYVYKSPTAALNEMKRVENNQNLKLHNSEQSTSGPCPAVGTHHNVRDGNKRVGSIGCCPCCTDTVAGPSLATRCRIIW